MNNIILYIVIALVIIFVIYKIYKKNPVEETPTTTAIPTTTSTPIDNPLSSIVNRLNFTNTEHFNMNDCKSISQLECKCKDVKLSNNAEITANTPCLLNLLYDIYLINSEYKKYIEDYYKEMTGENILDLQLNIDTNNGGDVIRNIIAGEALFLLILFSPDQKNITSYKYKNMSEVMKELYTNSYIPIVKLFSNLNNINSILYFTKCDKENCITQCDEVTPIAENQSKDTIYMKIDIGNISTTSNMKDKFTNIDCVNMILNNDNTFNMTKDNQENKVEKGINYKPDVMASETANYNMFDMISSYIKDQNDKYKNIAIPSNLLPTKLMSEVPTIVGYINKINLKILVYSLYLVKNDLVKYGISIYTNNSPYSTTTATISPDVLNTKNAIYNDILYNEFFKL